MMLPKVRDNIKEAAERALPRLFEGKAVVGGVFYIWPQARLIQFASMCLSATSNRLENVEIGLFQ